ncbi:hypothetical protein EW146_g3246 [Bondarzewia mesenterica]|uniref:Uncharacterized protein n=1 Tax=Bondarzewia mesenterica TaxID=1095465 RepID=A0A4S4LY32_9AGAM|nr:hypothetical protein EW146_g3246 [Bondarzewia mesenterica]
MSLASSSRSDSSSFTQIYQALPPDVQTDLIENHLLPLLDVLPKERSKHIISIASRKQKRYAGMPLLNYDAKATEINGLLYELDRDAKRSLLKERSNREELLEETMQSLASWMNDIWSVVYEYQTNFMLAHKCLLLAARTLDTLSLSRGGCKCSFMNMYVSVVIKQKSGKTVKSFHLTGAHNFDRVLSWIWRDLFLSVLAAGNERQKKQVPQMLHEIEEANGWPSLERILCGGRLFMNDDDDVTDCGDDDDAWEDEISDEGSLLEHSRHCPFHSEHWSNTISLQMAPLRRLVEKHLMKIFSVTPSVGLYSAVQAITADPDIAQARLIQLAQDGALTCSDSFVAALDIFTLENRPDRVCSLLDSGSHLLRPRDATSLQEAVSLVSNNRLLRPRVLPIVEKELLDTARGIKAALLSPFVHMLDPQKLVEMKQITALLPGSSTRQDRVEQWVDSVTTPGSNAPHPMAFAAMMMGIPLPAADAVDPDPMGFLELDQNDPDLEDLRDEFRPKMKERFEGWRETAVLVGGGSTTLVKVYKEVVQMMPFLEAGDIVDEILNRLSDKPSKHHVCDALEEVHAFVKKQRKKLAIAADKLRRREARQASAAEASSASPSSRGSTSPPGNALPTGLVGIASFPMSSHFGGIEDVD